MNGSVLYEEGTECTRTPGRDGGTTALPRKVPSTSLLLASFFFLYFFCIFSLQGIETFSHFDCFKKAFHITAGFCPVLSKCACTTPKRKGDVGPSSGRQGAGQRAGGASSALLFGFESPCHPVVLTSPQGQGYRGDGVMEQLVL